VRILSIILLMQWFRQKHVLVQLTIGFLGLGVAGFIFFFNTTRALPDPSDIVDIQVSQSTKIYGRGGEALLYEIYGEEKRTIIDPDDIPDFVREATISIEDDSFYDHPAFDWRGVLRAVFVNLIQGQVVQGGSTITQQLAKNAFLSPERTATRKLKELVLAMRLEQRYSKDEILDLYLNQVPYGENAYGIEAAAQTFFGKPAAELSLNEAALLASLPRSPSYYSPWGSHIDELETRKNSVLTRMWELGYIDDVQLQDANASMPDVLAQPETGIQAPHFVIHIQDYLREKYGEEALRVDGLRVVTTLDGDLQVLAEEAVANGVARNNELYGGGNGALVAIDPQTGHILAMVGSKDYFGEPEPDGCTPGKNCRFEGNFNVATQGLRQPGSALKPVAYLSAMERGFTPDTILWDVPTEFAPGCSSVVNFQNRSSACYHPQNFDLVFRGPVTMRQALAQSINVPAVKTLYLAGLNNTLNTASRMGITTLTDPERFGLSLVLGGGEVRLVELVSAYATLAADGIYREPVSIIRIENAKGEVLEEYEDHGVQAVSPQDTRIINDILSDVELRSGLFQSSLGLTQVPGHQVALKTGTTDDYVDAWAFGYTPNLAVGVWAGNNNREPLKSRGSSILAAVPMWHEFISKALSGTPLSTFNRPAPIFTDNPALRGQLVKGEFHNILYYVGRVGDPQFNNWEAGVRNWLQVNSVDTRRFTFVDASGISSGGIGGGRIDINVISPVNGSFANDPVVIEFKVSSENPVDKLEVYLNERLIDSESGVSDRSFTYRRDISIDSLDLQNLFVF
jgi:1A family penicillin-binding protein